MVAAFLVHKFAYNKVVYLLRNRYLACSGDRLEKKEIPMEYLVLIIGIVAASCVAGVLAGLLGVGGGIVFGVARLMGAEELAWVRRRP